VAEARSSGGDDGRAGAARDDPENEYPVPDASHVHSLPVAELDASHTHFLMVDGENAVPFRQSVERYISDTDLSDDQIQTPKVVLVIGGDLAVLRTVCKALNPDDESTGTSVPVLVVADSGGAAADIYEYVCRSEWDAEEAERRLPSILSGKGEVYAREAAPLLRRILKFGMSTGQNDSRQLSFFTSGDEADLVSGSTSRSGSLAFAIQTALLNDCPNLQQEALLAVSWGEPVILEQQLERHGRRILEKGAAKEDSSDASRPELDLLYVALMRGVAPVVSILMSHFESPSSVWMDALFVSSQNRYGIVPDEWARGAGFDGWFGSSSRDPLLSRGSSSSVSPFSMLSGAVNSGRELAGRMSEGAARVRSGTRMRVSPGIGEAAEDDDGLEQEEAEAAETRSALAGKRSGWRHASAILSGFIDGYNQHLVARWKLTCCARKSGMARAHLSPGWSRLNDVGRRERPARAGDGAVGEDGGAAALRGDGLAAVQLPREQRHQLARC
jgi:hypothetical protein